MAGPAASYVALAGAVDAAGRVVRRLGSSIGPSPYASHPGDTPSAFASASTVASVGMLAPVSVDLAVGCDRPDFSLKARIVSSRMMRISRSRVATPSQRKPSVKRTLSPSSP